MSDRPIEFLSENPCQRCGRPNEMPVFTPGWRPIETAPEFREVLVLTRSGTIYLATRFGGSWRWARGKFPRRQTPTRWQPLPAPPSVTIRRVLDDNREILSGPSRVCVWRQSENDLWETDCNHAFQFNGGGPYDNQMSACCYCGGELVEHPHDDAEDHSDG